MKTYIPLLLLACSISISAQQPLDTIYANDQKNVALFFHDPIRQGITGASHFVFTYNREKEQFFGLLQAKPGDESNLLVVTKTGDVYSYILKYASEITRLNYFIGLEGSIGNVRPKAATVPKKQLKDSSLENRVSYFERASAYLLRTPKEYISAKGKNGVRVELQKMVYYGAEVFLVLEIKNRSRIDFELDYVHVYYSNGNSYRKASYQRLMQQVLYSYKMPQSVLKGETRRFVYVLPKFVLGDNEKLIIELKEHNGGRKVVLETRN